MRPNTQAHRGAGAAARPQKPLHRAVFFGSIAITIACALTLIGVALRGLPTDEFGYVPHVLIVLVIAIFVTASLAITEIIPWGSNSLRDWQRPKVLGSFVGLIMGALGLAAGLTPLFNPPAATEKTLADVQRRLQDAGIAKGDASLVERGIPGTWGEPGCAVTYAIELGKGLLKITSAASLQGQSPLHMEFAAEPGAGSRLLASVIFPLQERGDAHVFVYEQSGTREFLRWEIRKREVSLKLDRC